MEKKVYDLIIDPEFQTVAPPLMESEMGLLREDIIDHGCKFPLITWNGILIDGHNRYAICRANDIPFAVEEMEFENRTEAKLWIIKNQLGRRNLKVFQRCEMVLPFEDEIKQEIEERRKKKISEYKKSGKTMPTVAGSTTSRDVLADMAGVSHTTLGRVKLILENADEDTKAKLRTEELKIGTVYNSIRQKPKPKAEKTTREEAKEEKLKKEEPEIQVDKPTIFNNTPELDEDDVTPPEDFSEVETQVEICIQDFMMNFRATMKWIGQHHVSGKNEAAVKALLKEGYEAAVETLHERFEELKGENK